MMRADLEVANVPTRDESGRIVDFHALRHTFITNLATAGVHPKVAQSLARHSTITLTMDRYTHQYAGGEVEALKSLPPTCRPHRATRRKGRAPTTRRQKMTPALSPTNGSANRCERMQPIV